MTEYESLVKSDIRRVYGELYKDVTPPWCSLCCGYHLSDAFNIHKMHGEENCEWADEFEEKSVKKEKFVTKDSGKHEEFESGMMRDTQDDKPRFDLMLPDGMPYDKQLITRWADLVARGAQKYSARNWEKASGQEELDRFRASAFRHFMQWYLGETDEDHAAAVLFNINGAVFLEWKMNNDSSSA